MRSFLSRLVIKTPFVGPRINALVRSLAEHKERINRLDARVAKLDARIAKIDTAVAKIDRSVAKGDTSVAKIGGLVPAVEARTALLERQIAHADARMTLVDARVDARMTLVDARLDNECVAASRSALLRATQAEAGLAQLRAELTQKIDYLEKQASLNGVSAANETSAPEVQSSVSLATMLGTQFDSAVSAVRGSLDPQHWPPVEMMLLAIGPLYNQLARRYAISATESDVLRTKINALRRELQSAARDVPERRGGWLAMAPPFPQSLTDLPGVLPIAIIDVGAQLLDSEGHVYAPLRATGHTRITGFEPLDASREKRQAAESTTRMLHHFVGDGRPATFYVTEFDPSSSTYEPNLPFLERFIALSTMCRPVQSYSIETTPLDSILDIDLCDYLKLDVQGGELAVLHGARRLLDNVLFVHSEVEFAPVYQNQPLFADIDSFLRSEGFELIDLRDPGYAGHSALPSRAAESRLLWSDAIYARDPRHLLESLDPSAIIRAAYIAHVNYGMYDLAAEYIAQYDRATGSSYLPSYTVLFD